MIQTYPKLIQTLEFCRLFVAKLPQNMFLLGQSSALYVLDNEIVLQVEEHNVCNMCDPTMLENYPDLKAMQSLAV